MSKRIELLAPAADFECLKAAISAGATSVYLGVGKMNARQYATNFSIEELKSALFYAHIRNVKIFVALNILFSDNQLNDVYELIDKLYLLGVDGLIIQDFGILNYVLNQYPDWFISASTQMSIDSLEGVKFLEKIGVKRVVLARECNIQQINYIKQNTNIEIEVFGHGALCVCVSGQCLLSHHIGARSGNRGTCAQPCRKKYQLININTNTKISELCYLLSMKDLKTIDRLPELINTNIDSLKIEGRMKSSQYVYNIVSHYANALENPTIPINDSKLNYTFQRTFTSGHLFNSDVSNIVNRTRPNHVGMEIGKVNKVLANGKIEIFISEKLFQNDFIRIETKNKDIEYKIAKLYDKNNNLINHIENGIAYIKIQEKPLANDKIFLTDSFNFNKEIVKLYPCEYKRLPLFFTIKGQINDYLKLIVYDDNGIIVEVLSTVLLEQATNLTLTHERIKMQLNKLNDTPYYLKKCIINIPNNAYIPIKELNELRRKAIKLLNEKKCYISRQSNILKIEKKKNINAPLNTKYILTAYVHTKEQYDACKEKGIEHIYFKNVIEEAHENYNIDFNSELLIGNYGGLNLSKKALSIANHNLNCYNHTSLYELSKYCERVTMSLEIECDDLINIVKNYINNYELIPNIEYVIYGKINLMTAKYCPLKHYNQCGLCKNNHYILKDEYGSFPIYTDNNCYLHILSNKPLNRKKDIIKLLPYVSYFRLNFTDESKIETLKIIDLYNKI